MTRKPAPRFRPRELVILKKDAAKIRAGAACRVIRRRFKQGWRYEIAIPDYRATTAERNLRKWIHMKGAQP